MTTATARRRPAPTDASWPRPLRWLAAAAAVTTALYAVALVHAAGQALLALVLLIVTALAVWTYASPRTQALRYLFPGVGAALLFVVFPMVYTMGIGFTNTSSLNLLDADTARRTLLQQAEPVDGSERPFELLAVGDTLRLRLPAVAERPALLSPPLPRSAPADEAEGTPGEGPAQATLALALAPTDDAAASARVLTLRETVPQLDALRGLALTTPDGRTLRLAGLRHWAAQHPLYTAEAGGSLREAASGRVYLPDGATGFFTADDGSRLLPGWRVGVGWQHYRTLFTEPRFRGPFASVFVWTVAFSALTVVGATALGLVLALLLNWDALRGRAAYRLVLFLPYAVPGFISILVFKGLFNQNLGEVNLILHGLFGIRPAWFSDPFLAKTMLLIVNIWLGFPYMMVLCTGLIQSIPADLREASAIAGAGPFTHFRRITLPLILKPLTPLLISTFAFNFNNFVLISLLTNGRPDELDASVPVGTTDILVSYTWRIAFQDSGAQFGLAAAISTVIFLLVALVTLLQLRLTRQQDAAR